MVSEYQNLYNLKIIHQSRLVQYSHPHFTQISIYLTQLKCPIKMKIISTVISKCFFYTYCQSKISKDVTQTGSVQLAKMSPMVR